MCLKRKASAGHVTCRACRKAIPASSHARKDLRVPMFAHELSKDMFREAPELARSLLRRCAGIEIVGELREASIDLSQVTSPEYRADFVVVARRGGRARVGIIVEIQQARDRKKHYAWPAYLGVLRSMLKCPVLLLVFAPDPAVARWARRPIELGHPRFSLTPVALSLAEIPRIADRRVAARLPQLAVLSTMAHPELAVAEIAAEAVLRLPEAASRLYLDVIKRALPDALRLALEVTMPYEYQSEFARRYVAQGREEGREEASVAMLGHAVLTVLAARGFIPTDRIRMLLRDCRDLSMLQRWLERASTVRTIDEVFSTGS